MRSHSISVGLVVGAYLLTGVPCVSTRNFVKFRLITFPNMPFGTAFLMNAKIGCVSSPLTSIFWESGNDTPKSNEQVCFMSASLTDSCPAN